MHLAKHLGEKEKATGKKFPLATADKVFSVLCPNCTERRDYRSRDLRQIELEGPPPREWKDLI